MRLKLTMSILALALVASAQELVGLPQYGIELVGDAYQPLVVNHSGKTIVAVNVRYEDTSAVPRTGGTTDFRWNSWIKNGDSAVTINREDLIGKVTIARMSIDGVVFSNGEFVGPDKFGFFKDIQLLFATYGEVASMVVSATTDKEKDAAWTVIIGWAAPEKMPRDKNKARWTAANLLFSVRETKGDQVYDLAKNISTIPALRRIEYK